MHWTYKSDFKNLGDYTGDFFYVKDDSHYDGGMVPYLKLRSDSTSDLVKCLCMEDKRIVSLGRLVTIVPLDYELTFSEKMDEK